MKPKGVTTQMKALNESFLMVVFTLLLNRVHVFAHLCLIWTVGEHGTLRGTILPYLVSFREALKNA